MSAKKVIPYKIYLEESEIPDKWYNVRAHMTNKPAPLIHPGTLQPLKFEDMQPIFCDELIRQELDNETAYIPIPEELRAMLSKVCGFPQQYVFHTEEGQPWPQSSFKRIWLSLMEASYCVEEREVTNAAKRKNDNQAAETDAHAALFQAQLRDTAV